MGEREIERGRERERERLKEGEKEGEGEREAEREHGVLQCDVPARDCCSSVGMERWRVRGRGGREGEREGERGAEDSEIENCSIQYMSREASWENPSRTKCIPCWS